MSCYSILINDFLTDRHNAARLARPCGSGCRPPVASFPDVKAVILIVMAWLLAGCVMPLWAAGEWQIVLAEGSEQLEVRVTKAGRHTLEIDDAFGFRTPVVRRDFTGSRLRFRALELGLIPGIEYHARLDGRPDVQDFRVVLSMFSEPEVSCANLLRTWEESGHRYAGVSDSRVDWDAAKGDWVVLPHDALIGQSLYPVEFYVRPALQGARACNDVQMLDEVARYYLVMLKFTEPLGSLLSRPRVLFETKERMATADPQARTFPALIGSEVADGELYNVQWLHPAAELLRLVSLLPPQQRTQAMQAFAAQYTKFIVVDQLDRYLTQQRFLMPAGGQASGRIQLWKQTMAGLKGEKPWDSAIKDIDLWLVASAADVLGANANDPSVAPLDDHQSAMLHDAVDTGIRFFQSKRRDYPTTKNFRGEQVGSVSYGDGDFAGHPDYDYSGVTSEKIPSPAEKHPFPNAGWDMMHAYRMPVFMRALYENRKATGSEWPQLHDLQLFVNQYLYRVFNGDYARPLFHNYLDGSDGWHRVGYHGPDFGYPPSLYCDQHNPTRPCFSPGTIMGWGLLAFANRDFTTLNEALLRIALDSAPEAKRFRDRYYFYGDTYEMHGPAGKQTYGLALYFLVGDNAEMIAAQPSPH